MFSIGAYKQLEMHVYHCIQPNACSHCVLCLSLANYNDLYQWSVDSYPDFWAEVWRFCGIVCSSPYEEVGVCVWVCHMPCAVALNKLVISLMMLVCVKTRGSFHVGPVCLCVLL